MADIRKRIGKNGDTYQVRYPNSSAKSGHSFKTFRTKKEARQFTEDNREWNKHSPTGISEVSEAVGLWLDICEKEGTDGQEPVTNYTLKNYRYRSKRMTTYNWNKTLQELTTPDIVNFRSWLLQMYSQDQARKALSSFHTVMKEMALRGHIDNNPANGISIKSNSRYDEPIEIPTPQEIQQLLLAADRLANSKNSQIARIWERYRPMLYLAVDSGMRPQEYVALPKSNIQEEGVMVTQAIERGGKISVTKTKAGRRFIDLSEQTLDMIRHYALNCASVSEYNLVFPTSSGRWQEVGNWRRRGFGAACIKAGLVSLDSVGGVKVEKAKYTPYALRHFYASMLIHQKVDLKKIQRLMGHEKIETTFNTYGHLIEEETNRAERRPGMIERLGSFIST